MNVTNNLLNFRSDGGTPGPPLPNRRPDNTPGTPNHQHSSQRLIATNSASSLVSRPPLPPPTSTPNTVRTRPTPIQSSRVSTADGYLRMNSASLTTPMKPVSQNSFPPFSPKGNWSPPPTFQEATGYSTMNSVGRDGYLNPRTSIELQEKALEKFNRSSPSSQEAYLSPTSEAEYETTFFTSSLPRERGSKSNSPVKNNDHYRLRSLSCEDIKKTQMRQRAKTTSSHDGRNRDTTTPEPFPKIQNFKGSMELLQQEDRGYYNIDGLKGTVDSSQGPTVAEVLQKFDEPGDKPVLTRAISNPNFLQLMNKEKLNDIRAEKAKSGMGSNPHLNKRSKSLLNLFKRSNKDRLNTSKDDSYVSNKSKSLPNSPNGSLQRQHSNPNITINVKGIHVTQRTRSFRKPRQYEKSPQVQRKDGKSPNIKRKTDNKSPQHRNHKHERRGSEPAVCSQQSPQPTRRTRHDITPSVSSTESDFANARPVCPSRQASSSSLKVHTVC